MTEEVRTLNEMRLQAESLLQAAKKEELSLTDQAIALELAERLKAEGNTLYQDRATMKLAVELFALARKLSNTEPVPSKKWGQNLREVSLVFFEDPIVDLTRSPWGISSLIAAQLETTLNDKVVKVTDGVRVGLRVMDENDQRAGTIWKARMMDLDLADVTPKKFRVRQGRAGDLVIAMDRTAAELSFDETSRVAWTQEDYTTADGGGLVSVTLHEIGESLTFDGTEADVTQLLTHKEAIWTMASLADEGKFRPVQVGSVRDGGSKYRR